MGQKVLLKHALLHFWAIIFFLFSPGKNLARKAVFIGAGLKTVTFGPKFLHSFAHD